MRIGDHLVAQLRKPTGFFGRQVVARFLSRANTTINQHTLEALAVEPEDRLLEAVRTTRRVRARGDSLHDSRRNAFPSGRFSKACAVNTIYFWPEPVVELTEIRRVLRPGGRFVASFMPRVTTARFGVHPAFRAYGGEEVVDLLGQVGFRDIRIIEGRERRGQFLCVTGTRP